MKFQALFGFLLFVCIGTTVTCQNVVSVEKDIVNTQNVYVCSMNSVEIIKSAINTTMGENTEDLKYIVESEKFDGNLIERKNNCSDDKVDVTLTHGSFTRLPNGDLFHSDGNMIFRSSEFYLDTYLHKDGDSKHFHVDLEARVCVDVPTVSFCCQKHETIQLLNLNGTTACLPASELALLERSVPVTFDGSTAEWSVNESVTGFPNCGERPKFTLLDQRYGYLQLISNNIQFQYEIPRSRLLLKLDSPAYCVGLYESGATIRKVAAYCANHEQNLCKEDKILLESLQDVVPTEKDFDVGNQNFNVCFMEAYEFINSTINVTMVVSTESNLVYTVKSEDFGNIIERKNSCSEDEIEVTLTHGSFSLLPNGDLFHTDGDMTFRSSQFCFDPYVHKDEDFGTFHVDLEARACVDVPTVSFCCQKHETIQLVNLNGTTACLPASELALLESSVPVTFDGSTAEWTVNESVTGLPICGERPTFSKLGHRHGYLHLISNNIQFRSEITRSGRLLKLNPSAYCVGQYESGATIITVAAYCANHKQNLCTNY